MNIKTYISRIGIERAKELFGLSEPGAKHWRNGIRNVPPERVIEVCAATSWEVTPHEVRPDIYPNPWDGLPIGIASAQSQEADHASA